MAQMLGEAIVAGGFKVLTGGRRGAGELVAKGAAHYCITNGMSIEDYVFALVPFSESADFPGCRVVHAGADRFERSYVLMNRVRVALVLGGAAGTEHEVMHAAVDYYMAGGTARLLPVSGTGGTADRILMVHGKYDDPILDDRRPSAEKAAKLVALAGAGSRCPIGYLPYRLWGVDIHEGWLSGDPHPVVRYTYKIRHYGKRIQVEGEDDFHP